MNAVDEVKAFLETFSRPDGGWQEAMARWFTPETQWENVGIVTTTGPDEGAGLMKLVDDKLGVKSIRIETLAIAAMGNRVLTERVDYFLSAEGGTILPLRIMGAFDLDDAGKILSWRDYADPSVKFDL